MSNRVDEPLKYAYNLDALRPKGNWKIDYNHEWSIDMWKTLRDLEPDDRMNKIRGKKVVEEYHVRQ